VLQKRLFALSHFTAPDSVEPVIGFHAFHCIICEKKHMHVRKGDGVAKFWLEPVELFRSSGFRPPELREIREIIEQNHDRFSQQWDRYL
jgi:hypothetical protein